MFFTVNAVMKTLTSVFTLVRPNCYDWQNARRSSGKQQTFGCGRKHVNHIFTRKKLANSSVNTLGTLPVFNFLANAFDRLNEKFRKSFSSSDGLNY